MSNIKKSLSIFLLLIMVALPNRFAIASSGVAEIMLGGDKEKTKIGGLRTASAEAGYDTATTKQLVPLIGTYLQYILSFLGVIFLCLIIYAGFTWMLARGNNDEAKKAKDMMINAVIGLVIILAGYALSAFIMNTLVTTISTAPSQ